MEAVPVSDPRVPAGLPIPATTVIRKTRRDSPVSGLLPIRPGACMSWRAWVIHDPACPADVHASIRGVAHQRNAGLVSSYLVLGSVSAAAATAAWVVSAGAVAASAGQVEGQVYASIDQNDVSGLCVWWVAEGQGIILG